MKTKVLSLITLLFIGSGTVFAGTKTDEFKVDGKCSMCEKRIEKAATSLNGVEAADWNKKTGELSVSYDDQKTSVLKIQTAIAMAGHDTGLFSASDARYAELPGCCQYERDSNRKTNNHASPEVPGVMKKTGKKTECVHDKSPTSGSCCGK
jgi:copper chaperone CopZ